MDEQVVMVGIISDADKAEDWKKLMNTGGGFISKIMDPGDVDQLKGIDMVIVSESLTLPNSSVEVIKNIRKISKEIKIVVISGDLEFPLCSELIFSGDKTKRGQFTNPHMDAGATRCMAFLDNVISYKDFVEIAEDVLCVSL